MRNKNNNWNYATIIRLLYRDDLWGGKTSVLVSIQLLNLKKNIFITFLGFSYILKYTAINNIRVFNDFWVVLENYPDANIHDMLSHSRRRRDAVAI